jgi:hypothetical protein
VNGQVSQHAEQAVEIGDPVHAALRRGGGDHHVALVVEHVAADDEVDRGNVQGGAGFSVGFTLLDDVQLLAFEGEEVLVAGLGHRDRGRQSGEERAVHRELLRRLRHELH